MPNWIEGSMKLRGETKDLKKFFEEGITVYKYEMGIDENGEPKFKETEIDKNKYLKIEYEDENGFDVRISKGSEPYIKGTRRAFIIEPDIIFVYNGYACFNIQQAWDFSTENFIEIAKKYNLDVRLFGIERGMKFAREIEISKTGDVVIDKEITYDDFCWDCPFPNLGG
jgi:hypothetical protein